MWYDAEVDLDMGMQNDSLEECIPTKDYKENEYFWDSFEDGNIPVTKWSHCNKSCSLVEANLVGEEVDIRNALYVANVYFNCYFYIAIQVSRFS